MVVPEEELLYGGMVAGIFGRYVVNVMCVPCFWRYFLR